MFIYIYIYMYICPCTCASLFAYFVLITFSLSYYLKQMFANRLFIAELLSVVFLRLKGQTLDNQIHSRMSYHPRDYAMCYVYVNRYHIAFEVKCSVGKYLYIHVCASHFEPKANITLAIFYFSRSTVGHHQGQIQVRNAYPILQLP